MRRVLAALAVLLVAAACGSDSGGEVTTAATTTTPVTAVKAATDFCTEWKNAMASDDEAEAREVLRNAPAEISDAAAVVRAAVTGDDSNAEAELAAMEKVTRWVELNCTDPSRRHVAPPAGAPLPDLTLCSAGTPPVPAADPTDEKVVLYGEAGRADSYDGPMIGVFTKPEGEGGYRGDGTPTSVTVRGKAGDAAPITVFQQAILPELGTVIAWTEDGYDVGLFGRLWNEDQANELVALAERLEFVDGHFKFPTDSPPDGYKEVFAGSPDLNWSIVAATIGGEYQVSYRGGGEPRAIVTVAGLQLTEEEFGTFRFLGFPIPHARIGDRDALFGGLWSEATGPFVATWREPDGFTVRVSGIGATSEQVRAVAEQSRDLNRAEWVALVESAEHCDFTGVG